jgi:hypothetical protein
MLMWETEDFGKNTQKIIAQCEESFAKMNSLFGYSKRAVWESLVFSNSLGKTIKPN